MIDLHVHSTASDGTFTPEELAGEGRALLAMALTDHDNQDGCQRFLAASARLGAKGLRLPGIELSVEPGEGYSVFHLLGLGVDPSSPAMAELLRSIRDGREERNRRMAERLTRLGMPVTLEEVSTYAHGEIVARPHFARCLMARGYVKEIKEAFQRFLAAGAPAYVERFHPEPAVAIAAIHAAHGVAVMAHPRFWTSEVEALRTGFTRLRTLGLDGVEAFYSINTPLETALHLRLAREAGLLVTAGSDFHGANKSDIRLGMAVDDEEAVVEELLGALRRWNCPFVQPVGQVSTMKGNSI